MSVAASVLVQFAVGLILGLGLVIAGMSDPAKVLSSLDIAAVKTGGWDPSLAFVLIGAIAVTFVGYKLTLKRAKPFFSDAFHLPKTSGFDSRIIVGPAIFGVGWGIAGLCPGPAFTALTTGGYPALIFIIAMFCGMGSARWVANSSARSRPAI